RVTQGNTAAQQEFANLMSNANLSNSQRAEMFSELVTKYQLPLQKYTALFNNAAVNPTVGTSVPTPTQGVAPTDVGGITNKGYLPSGMSWYEYDKGPVREQGVMAHEVKKFLPQAVKKGRDGYDRVDYS